MTDPKTPPDMEEVDWDEALAEWEEKSFSPEVARDVVTDKPAALSGSPTPRPLYKPPTAAEPRPAAPQAELGEDQGDDDDGGATLIAAIPEELLRRGDEPSRAASPRGGLGQLFARDSAGDVLGDRAVSGRDSSDPPDVVTSAKSVASHPEGPAVEPRQRATAGDGTDAVPEGEWFDPFADTGAPGARPSSPPTARDARPAPADRSGPAAAQRSAPAPAQTALSRAGRTMPPAKALRPPAAGSAAASPAPKSRLQRLPSPPALKFEGPRLPSTAAKADRPHRPPGTPDAEGPRARFVAPEIDGPRLPSVAPTADGPRLPSVAPTIDGSLDAETTIQRQPAPTGTGASGLASQPQSVSWDEVETSVRVAPIAASASASPVRARPARGQPSAPPADALPPAPLPSAPPAHPTASKAPPAAPLQDRAPIPTAWADEKPAEDWIDGRTRLAFEQRATWLEEEARSLADASARGRALLACSELFAIAGHRERAQSLASEARDCSETLALAHRQARMLMPWPPDPDDHVESLELEVETSAPGPARLHSLLLEAEALRARGDEDGAMARLEQAARSAGADLRAATLRAASALAAGMTSGPALRLPDSTELAPLVQAIGTCLSLRGVDPMGGDPIEGTDGAPDPSPNETVLRARQALGKGDVAAAAPIVARLAQIPELASGARWLAACFAATAARALSVGWLKELAESGDGAAAFALVARGIELGDGDLVADVVGRGAHLTSADRLAVATLMGNAASAENATGDALVASSQLRPLLCGAWGVMPSTSPQRAERTAGALQSRLEIELGRKLASGASDADVALSLGKLPERSASAQAVGLELSARAGRIEEISRTVEGWKPSASSAGHPATAALAAALLAERAGATTRSTEAFKAAHAVDPGCEVALRALASLDAIDHVAQLNALADEWTDGVRSALARIEAVARGGASLPEPTQAHLLELAHRSAPTLPIASFLAERIARRSGDVDEVLRWIRERRDRSDDAVEGALETVREALLVADSDPELAGRRLREAHAVRPRDAALRDLYERMAADRPDDVAPWREQRAAEAIGAARVVLSLEAAYELERQGDDGGALRCAAAAAEAGEASLARVARERSELRTGRVARLTDELLAVARDESAGDARREAYERLAVLDAVGRNDLASALLWHRSVLELAPEHQPSLRHVEHHLIGEGREDELESIAASIAAALRGGGAGECTAHAELAARLRLREISTDRASPREMVDLATAESGPSLWAVRLLYQLSRARNDAPAALAAAKLIIDRLSRPLEIAFMLVRAAEAAAALDLHDEARSLLERATVHDPGDVQAWSLLAETRKRARDLRGAAEASESLARCSGVPARQLSAWYDAATLWMDELHDDERSIAALEAAAAVDLAHADVFDRLSRLYAGRKMQSELADLLQRRIDGVADPDERLAIEIQRGRVLLEVGEMAGARRAFEAALDERPDDPGALSAFADLCIQDRDWQVAEQALVRLARLLPTPEEQRAVYARLGDLYSRHLVNLSRAEVALKEVLKRAPDDVDTMAKLVDVHKRQNDPARAAELQQNLVARATSQGEKRDRILELAAIHERVARDLRRAERTLDAARRDSPQDVVLLRTLAEFYVRHQQTSAVNILLDRAAADARRALASGRAAAESFQIVATAFELRGQPKAAAAALSILSAIEGKPSKLQGAGERALDPALDDALAPDLLSPAIRSLLAKAGDMLDAASPVDLRDLRATPLPASSPVSRLATRMAAAIGVQGLQILSSSKLGSSCLPVGSTPAIVLGDAIANDESVGAFLAIRSLKLIRARASTLVRCSPAELPALVSAWLKRFHPKWEPQGVPAPALDAAYGKLQAALPRQTDPDPNTGILALEASASIDGRQASLGAAVLAWANRVALLAQGDPTAALDALACAAGMSLGKGADPHERGTWISRSPEARDLVAFGAGDAFAQTRSRLGLNS